MVVAEGVRILVCVRPFSVSTGDGVLSPVLSFCVNFVFCCRNRNVPSNTTKSFSFWVRQLGFFR